VESREDRLLRVWTPRILRGVLGASVAFLVAGLLVIAFTDPASYVARYHALQSGYGAVREVGLSELVHGAAHGEGTALLVAGLLLLTLVPIGRVAFTFVVFVVERDWVFAGITGLVLTLLGVGVLLGRMG